jgi:hypothetical protein
MSVLIPSRYSRYVFGSVPFLLATWYTAYKRNYTRLSVLLPCLLTTSILHWNRPRPYGWIRRLDMLCALLTIVSITFYDSRRFSEWYHYLWRWSCMISGFVYGLNHVVFWYKIKYMRPVTSSWLSYTEPFTSSRTKAYCYSVYTHMIFVHMLLSWTCLWGMKSESLTPIYSI